MAKEKTFLVTLSFRAEVDGENAADALANAAVKVRYAFDKVDSPSIRVSQEIPPATATQQENKPEPGQPHPVFADVIKTVAPPRPRADGNDIPF